MQTSPFCSNELSESNEKWDSKATLRLIHFNDVYHVEESDSDPSGGAPRFIKAVKDKIKEFKQDTGGESIVCFSGDAFSPGALTPFTEGKEIPPVLNMAQVEVACLGNHELDRGLETMQERMSECKFPWLMSNIIDRQTNSIIGNCKQYHIIEKAGLRIGFIGLGSQDWINSLSIGHRNELECINYISKATELAGQLRLFENCNIVIALTHMCIADDLKLAAEARGIDLVLGGHDHDPILDKRNGIYIVKSGTEFQKYSIIDINVYEDRIHVNSPRTIVITPEDERDEEATSFVDEQMKVLEGRKRNILARTDVVLDGTTTTIRTQETALGNMVTDIMAKSLQVPLALVNSGSFRSNAKHTGLISSYTIGSILGFSDCTIGIKVTGEKLLEILEHGVTKYPITDGRFGQVSGIEFTFDGSKDPGERLLTDTVRCRNEAGDMEDLDVKKEYLLATKEFIHSGGDAYPLSVENEVAIRSDYDLITDIEHYLIDLPVEDGQEYPKISPQVENRITIINPRSAVLE